MRAWSLRKKGERRSTCTQPLILVYIVNVNAIDPAREVLLERDERRLESEEQQKRHHETKETHGLGKGETQNGVGEKLLFEGRVPRVADDEGAEHGADTGAGSGHAHCSSTRTDVLGRRIDIHDPRGCLERANWDNAER